MSRNHCLIRNSPNYIGAGVAGVLVGVLVIAVALVICIRRRRRRGHTSDFHDSADAESGNNFPESFDISSRSISIPTLTRPSRTNLRPVPPTAILAATISPFPHGRMPAHPMARPTRHATSDSIGLASGGPPQNFKPHLDTDMSDTTITSMESGITLSSMSIKSPSSSGTRSTSGAARLTDEQLDFVAGLQKNNIPAEAIARLMERMLTGEFSMSLEGRDEFLDGLLEASAPPSYESHATVRA